MSQPYKSFGLIHMKSFIVTDNHIQSKCTFYQIQKMLTFIGIKHNHVQQIMDVLQDKIPLHKTIELLDLYQLLRSLLLEHHYENTVSDINTAYRIMNRDQSVCILLGGTSGCGKSTLASLLAHRIDITTVLSTDHVRSLLRSFDQERESKLLWASSYYAAGAGGKDPDEIIRGYEAQNQLMLDTLDKMISVYFQRNESLVIEGVALSVQTMVTLSKKYPHCIPILIYMSNEQKHAERFAIRAKHMTVAPHQNKYIYYFDNIRMIQEHLCKDADLHLIPKINNTNVDRSLAILHSAIINIISRIHEQIENKQQILYEEYLKVYKNTLSSKQVLQNIHSNGKKKEVQHLELEHLDDTAWGSLAS